MDAAKKKEVEVEVVAEAEAEGESSSANSQQKRKRDQDALVNDLLGSSANHSLKSDNHDDTQKSSSSDTNDQDCSEGNDEDDESIEDYEEYYYDDELIDDDSNDNLSSKFDDLDLPPGVEATVPWMVTPEKSSDRKQKNVVEDEFDINFRSFKKFDTVKDFKDHHYARKSTTKSVNPSKEWAKRIQHEWKVLENDLPEMIYVRVYEERMDLLRAVIVGPAGTPYHDGLFFFDAQFPSSYPAAPPSVHYHSGGLRLNPNLYANGYVCLSLLGTWQGQGCEKWKPQTSTMLQVLVSIQALVLNEKPFFNEPGYETYYNSSHGENKSIQYNESTFVLSCRTMLYTLRKPPMHFGELVAGHFRKQGRTILAACKAYMDGLQVGSAFQDDNDDEEAADVKGEKRKTTFTSSLKVLFEDLLLEFTVKGADCDKFLAQKVKAGVAAAAAAARSTGTIAGH